jgi:hypothetical protein
MKFDQPFRTICTRSRGIDTDCSGQMKFDEAFRTICATCSGQMKFDEAFRAI